MVDIPDDNPSNDVAQAIAQLQDGSTEPRRAEEAPPPVDVPSTERRQPSYNEYWKAQNRIEETPKAERTRDQRGRFSKAASPEDSARADVVRSIDMLQGKPVAPEKTEPVVDVRQAPARLRAEDRAVWNQVPPQIQAAWHQMEADTQRGVDKLRASYAAIDQALAPHRQSYASYGFRSDGHAVQALLAGHQALLQDPVRSIAFLYQNAPAAAQEQLRAMLAGQAPQQYYTQQPADIGAIVRNEIGLAEAGREIEAFAANPDFPHFHAVRPLMSQLLQNSKCETLEEAYTAAVMADPQLRQAHFAQLEARDANNRRRSVAVKKRAAAVSMTGAPHGATAPARRSNGHARSNFDDAVGDVRDAISQLS